MASGRIKDFKGNVIIGHLIPAGTGLPTYKMLKVTLPLGGEIPMDDAPLLPKPVPDSSDDDC